MHVKTATTTHVLITLDHVERYKAETRARTDHGTLRLPFLVEQVSYTIRDGKPGKRARLHGPAIRADGTSGLVNRHTDVPLSDLPATIRAALAAATKEIETS